MGRPSTARIARARAFSSWFGGFCTHLDGDELILLLEEHHEGDPEPCPVRVEFAPKRHENVIEPSIETCTSNMYMYRCSSHRIHLSLIHI